MRTCHWHCQLLFIRLQLDIFVLRLYEVILFSMGRHAVSVEVKWQVVGMHKTGMSYRQIASALNVSKTCVENTVKRYAESGSVLEAPRSGRPRKTSPRQDRKLLNLSRRNRNASASDLLTKMNQDGDNVNISVSTVSSRLRDQGMHSYFALRKPLLNSLAQKRRKIWCRERRNWLKEAWRRVIFSDECRFEIFPRRKIRVRRTKTEKFLPACVAPAVQMGGEALMVWGCITSEGPGELYFVDGTVNSTTYCQILEETMLPSAARLLGENFIFQQDNAPCHKSRQTMAWLADHDVEVLPWPARSPDLNPIENIWNTMAMRLAKHKPSNKTELRFLVANIWRQISKEECCKLIDSMPKRVDACRKAKGCLLYTSRCV